MDDGQNSFFQGEISDFGFLEGLADIVNRLLGPFLNLY